MVLRYAHSTQFPPRVTDSVTVRVTTAAGKLDLMEFLHMAHSICGLPCPTHCKICYKVPLPSEKGTTQKVLRTFF